MLLAYAPDLKAHPTFSISQMSKVKLVELCLSLCILTECGIADGQEAIGWQKGLDINRQDTANIKKRTAKSF